MRAGFATPAILLLLTAPSCQDTSLLAPCQALVAAEPSEWPMRWRATQALGPRATTTLVRCLRENQDGPGRQAAIHLLGDWHDPTAAAYLRELVAAKGPDTTEAALGLGKLGDPAVAALLVATVQDRDLATDSRVAAACALLDLGQPRHAVPLMQAVLLAATPYGTELRQAQGLPQKTRWAFERYMMIEAVRRFSNGETFGLDEDASWPRLRDGTAAFVRYAEQRQDR
jgi:HEAT repeat protein